LTKWTQFSKIFACGAFIFG